jgi:hypothetical protein
MKKTLKIMLLVLWTGSVFAAIEFDTDGKEKISALEKQAVEQLKLVRYMEKLSKPDKALYALGDALSNLHGTLETLEVIKRQSPAAVTVNISELRQAGDDICDSEKADVRKVCGSYEKKEADKVFLDQLFSGYNNEELGTSAIAGQMPGGFSGGERSAPQKQITASSLRLVEEGSGNNVLPADSGNGYSEFESASPDLISSTSAVESVEVSQAGSVSTVKSTAVASVNDSEEQAALRNSIDNGPVTEMKNMEVSPEERVRQSCSASFGGNNGGAVLLSWLDSGDCASALRENPGIAAEAGVESISNYLRNWRTYAHGKKKNTLMLSGIGIEKLYKIGIKIYPGMDQEEIKNSEPAGDSSKESPINTVDKPMLNSTIYTD